MNTLFQDLRYALRTLTKRPGFTLTIIMTLALGIGANTAIFSVVMAVLVRPLPYHEPERLVWLANTNDSLGVKEAFLNPEDILDYREQATTLEQVASWGTFPINLSGGKQPERVESIYVTTNFFRTLGVKPLLGRDFLPDDAAADGVNGGNVIISHGLWQRQFGSDPNVIGRSVVLMGNADKPALIIGIMPPEMNFPPHVDLFETYEYEERSGRGGTHNDRTIARLKPGVTLDQAQAELSAIARRQGEQFPDTNRGWDVVVMPLREYLFGSANRALPLLFGAVAFVLAVACTNVAGLQLARALSLQKEIAVRLALGAGRWHIVRQLLTESLLLSLPGGGVGLLLASWGIEILRALGPDSLPRLKETTLDATALIFTVGVSLLSGILFGIVPALKSSKPDLNEMLKDISRGSSGGGRNRHRLRGALVVSQFAMAVVLLVGAGLMIKSFWKLHQSSPGFQSEQVLAAGLSLNIADFSDPARRTPFYQQTLERVAALPGVEAAAAISHVPFGGRTMQLSFRIEGREPVSKQNQSLADYRVVSPSLFETLRIPVRYGRTFTERDTATSPIVYVVNEAFSETYFPGDDPLGKRIRMGSEGQWLGEIIGVVGDVKHRSAEAKALPTIYVCYLQCTPLPSFPIMNFIVRTTSNAEGQGERLRQTLLEASPNQVVFYVRPMTEFLSEATAQRRFTMLLLVLFAVVALMLAVVGVYGLMSYIVAERRREIAIHLALGAQTADVLKMVLGRGIRLVAGGGAVGLAAAAALTRLMASMLYGVSATDPSTFAAIAALLIGVALAACFVPARRAARTQPNIVLRYE